MMKSAQIPFSDDTKFSLIRGLIINGSQEDFKTALQKYPLILDEEKFLIALEDSCSNNKHLWLQKVCELVTYMILFSMFAFAAYTNGNNGIIFAPISNESRDVMCSLNSSETV